MRTKILISHLFLTLTLLISQGVSAQNIGINSTGNAANSSAMLDVDATNKGFLIPRMTTAQRDAIVNPALSLLIFNTTTNCYEGFSGIWQSINCPTPAAALISLTCASADITGTVVQNVAASGVTVSIPYTGGNGGIYAAQTISSTGVSGLTASISSGTLASGAGNLLLTISGTSATAGSANFLLTIGGQSCSFTINVCASLPGAFTAIAATNICTNSFSANWTASAGATAYFIDVSTNNTFSTFVLGYSNLNVGNVLTYSITGLTYGTTYYYRIRAYNGCATSTNSNTITLTTTLTGCVVSQTAADYGTASYIGLTWITRNLGALNQPVSATDMADEAGGCYFQFNRSTAFTNNLCDNSFTVSPNWTITNISENSNWIIANDPCRQQLGSSWRLPTDSEWATADVTGSWNNANNAFSSNLKLHSAGVLNTFGNLVGRGVSTFFWSSVQLSMNNGLGFFIDSGNALGTNSPKAYGSPVRCVF